jgi:hypothetical protein
MLLNKVLNSISLLLIENSYSCQINTAGYPMIRDLQDGRIWMNMTLSASGEILVDRFILTSFPGKY